MIVKKFMSIVLVLTICVSTSFIVLANVINTNDLLAKSPVQLSDDELADKLQMPIEKLNKLSPELIEQLHKDFDSVDIVSMEKSHYILEKSTDTDEEQILMVSEPEFTNIVEGVEPRISEDKYFVGVGTLTSYILSDNSIAMSMELLDSYSTGGSDSFETLMTIKHRQGRTVGGTTLYSRNRVDGSRIDRGDIERGFDYIATVYTVPEMVTEMDRYFYLTTDCEGNTSGQVINTDFAVCTYELNITSWSEKLADLFDSFLIDSKTKHYSYGARA